MTRALGARSRSTLAKLVSEEVQALRGDVVDMGCGAGALHGRRDIFGIDESLAMAKLFGTNAIVADAADPPFGPASFDAVLLLNLLDSCHHPRLVLAQADALLRPSGTLVVSCAYAWTPAVSQDRRFQPEELVACLTADPEHAWIRGRYRLTTVRDNLRWRLPITDRLIHEYRCQLVVARKRSAR